MAKKLTVKQIKQMIERLKGDRGVWESHWQEVADYILPRKNTILTKRTPGEKTMQHILDATGVLSCELLSGALHGLLTNPDALWFELTTGDVDLDREDDVRLFLQKCSQKIHNVLNNSNFQTEVHELYIDLTGFGTSLQFIEEDPKMVVRFNTYFIGEYFIVENNRGLIDQVFREWKWDSYKIVKEFGIDKVHQKIRDSFEKGKDDKFIVQHAVYPRDMVDPNHRSAFTYISQYTLPELDYELREAGFREFPYVVPRWTKAAGETYGRSPGMSALPEVKVLNKMTETMLIGAQKVVDPPLQMPDDGFILPIATHPGGLNFARSGTNDIIRPIFNDSRIDFGFQAMEDRRRRVRESFYIDQLQLGTQGPQMTATEVLQRTEEKMRLLGPMLGRQQSEFLRPLIDRVFGICLRRGIISQEEIPAILTGRSLDVKYSSLIAKSQRLSEGQNLLRGMEALTPFVNMDPQVVDNFDGDKASKVIANVYGIPQEIIRKKKDVDAIRQSRAQAQQAALDQQQAQMQTEQAPKVADTMTKIQQMG